MYFMTSSCVCAILIPFTCMYVTIPRMYFYNLYIYIYTHILYSLKKLRKETKYTHIYLYMYVTYIYIASLFQFLIFFTSSCRFELPSVTIWCHFLNPIQFCSVWLFCFVIIIGIICVCYRPNNIITYICFMILTFKSIKNKKYIVVQFYHYLHNHFCEFSFVCLYIRLLYSVICFQPEKLSLRKLFL